MSVWGADPRQNFCQSKTMDCIFFRYYILVFCPIIGEDVQSCVKSIWPAKVITTSSYSAIPQRIMEWDKEISVEKLVEIIRMHKACTPLWEITNLVGVPKSIVIFNIKSLKSPPKWLYINHSIQRASQLRIDQENTNAYLWATIASWDSQSIFYCHLVQVRIRGVF